MVAAVTRRRLQANLGAHRLVMPHHKGCCSFLTSRADRLRSLLPDTAFHITKTAARCRSTLRDLDLTVPRRRSRSTARETCWWPFRVKTNTSEVRFLDLHRPTRQNPPVSVTQGFPDSQQPMALSQGMLLSISGSTSVVQIVPPKYKVGTSISDGITRPAALAATP